MILGYFLLGIMDVWWNISFQQSSLNAIGEALCVYIQEGDVYACPRRLEWTGVGVLTITLHMDFEPHQTPLGPKEPPLSKEWSWFFAFEVSPHKDTRSKGEPLSASPLWGFWTKHLKPGNWKRSNTIFNNILHLILFH